jgi:hypothetical protein
MFDIQSKVNEALKQGLSDLFLTFKPSEDWYKLAYESLNFTCPIALGETPEEMLKLVKALKTKRLSYYQFGLLSNNIEGRSPNQLNMNLETYLHVMIQAADLAEQWNKDTKTIREDITKQVIDEMQNKIKANGNPLTKLD